MALVSVVVTPRGNRLQMTLNEFLDDDDTSQCLKRKLSVAHIDESPTKRVVFPHLHSPNERVEKYAARSGYTSDAGQIQVMMPGLAEVMGQNRRSEMAKLQQSLADTTQSLEQRLADTQQRLEDTQKCLADNDMRLIKMCAANMMVQLVKKLCTVKHSMLAEIPNEHSSTNIVRAAKNITLEDLQRVGLGQKQLLLLKKFPLVEFAVLTILPSLHCRDTKFKQIESWNESALEKPEKFAHMLLAHRDDGGVMTALYHQLEPVFEFVYSKKLVDFAVRTELDEIADLFL